MSKLIDADGLIAQAQSARFDGKWFDEVIARRSIVRWINSQPDASEPLRARIKELEAENSRLSFTHARVNEIWLKAARDRVGITPQFYSGLEFMAKKVLDLLEGKGGRDA